MQSTLLTFLTQSDGRAYVTERHVDQFGMAHSMEYLADAETDRDAMLQTHADQLAEQLRQSELDSWLADVKQGKPIPVGGCKYVTRDEAFTYCFRSLVLDPDVQALYPAAWMVPYFTDAEFAAMGFTAEQIITIRESADKLSQAKALLDDVTPLEVV